MIARYVNGHLIVAEPGRDLAESDPCPVCRKLPTPEGHDACIANLPGVQYACCGHGLPDTHGGRRSVGGAYLIDDRGARFDGEQARIRMRILGGRPPSPTYDAGDVAYVAREVIEPPPARRFSRWRVEVEGRYGPHSKIVVLARGLVDELEPGECEIGADGNVTLRPGDTVNFSPLGRYRVPWIDPVADKALV